MAKYIRAHAMKINIDFNTDEITRTAPTDILMRIIDEIEAPDGVDIVFCKDCKHATEYIDSQNHSWLYCENWRATDGGNNEGYYHIEDDFFCADGERRKSE